MQQHGPYLHRAHEILNLDRWCFSEKGVTLYGKYFEQKCADEDGLNERQKTAYNSIQKSYMLARQIFESNPCEHTAADFFQRADQFSAYKIQLGFRYASLTQFHYEEVIAPEVEKLKEDFNCLNLH